MDDREIVVGSPIRMAHFLLFKASPKDKVHPASCSMGIRGAFLKGKVAGA
jgi:hypothetical protein